MGNERDFEAARCDTQRFGINFPASRRLESAGASAQLNEHLLVLRGLAHRRIPAPRKQKLEAFAHARDHGRHFLDGRDHPLLHRARGVLRLIDEAGH